MAKTISIKASARKAIGSTAVKSLRRNGQIPGVIYGKRGTQAIVLNAKELNDALYHAHSENVLVDLQLADESKSENRLAFLQDVQHDSLADSIVHVDLHEIAPDEKLHAEVKVVELGEAIGVRSAGGLLEVVLRKLRIECLPKDLPDAITIDVSHLNVGESIHVGEITLPAGVIVLNPKEQPVIAVLAATKEEEIKPSAVADQKQPEVLKEKNKDAAAAVTDAKSGTKGKGDAKSKGDGKK